jgi:hypothetical protein
MMLKIKGLKEIIYSTKNMYPSYILFKPKSNIFNSPHINLWLCEVPFNAQDFLNNHTQYEWMNGLIKDRPTQPWTMLKAGETK